MQWSQHFILPNSAYLLGIKHKEEKKEYPKIGIWKDAGCSYSGKGR